MLLVSTFEILANHADATCLAALLDFETVALPVYLPESQRLYLIDLLEQLHVALDAPWVKASELVLLLLGLFRRLILGCVFAMLVLLCAGFLVHALDVAEGGLDDHEMG